jgi:hypothetical protein
MGDGSDWVDDVTDLDWFKSYVFSKDVTLPGESRLHVEVGAHDMISYSYCAHTVLILYSYCAHTVLIL